MNTRLYFGNLLADVARCLAALRAGNENRYEQSLARARKTLAYLRTVGRPEAYEEGLLLVYGLTVARREGNTQRFQAETERMAASYAIV